MLSIIPPVAVSRYPLPARAPKKLLELAAVCHMLGDQNRAFGRAHLGIVGNQNVAQSGLVDAQANGAGNDLVDDKIYVVFGACWLRA